MAKPKAETNTPAAAVTVDADTKEETPVTKSNAEQRMAEIVVPETGSLPHLTTADIRFMPAKVAGVTAPAKRASVQDVDEKLSMIVLDSGRTLSELENVVRVGLDSFIKAGEALLEIRARGLWKETGAKSFGQYAVTAFNISRPRVYQLVDVAQVAAILVNNGRALPSIGSRLNEFAPVKDDPAKLLEVADKVAATTPTGDLGEAPKGTIKAAVDEATGKEPKAPAAAPAPVNGTTGGNLAAMNGGSATGQPTNDEITAAANGATAPASTPAAAPSITRASPAALRADEKIAPQSLTTVIEALTTGAYVDNASGATKAAIQKLAAMCLSYMAQDWAGAPPRVAPAYVISIAQAKEIVRGLKKAQKVDGQAKAKAALSGEAAAQVAKNEAVVAASAPAPATEVVEVAEEVTLVANPTTAAEAYAILDASRVWIEAGSKGKRPVTGTQINRADALLNKLTEEAAKEGVADDEADESDEADDIAEAEATGEAEEIDLGIAV